MSYALKVAGKVHGIHLELNVVSTPAEGKYTYGTIDLMDLGLIPADEIPDTSKLDVPEPFGVGACALGGEAAFQYVVKVIQLATDGQIDATVTNALSKEAINMVLPHRGMKMVPKVPLWYKGASPVSICLIPSSAVLP